ncbi:unnamed protein product [marine sediment metagenome]|uniref:Uncharacterized protein n=1 Tax=marine sediment metagenome TaxID=412755 RepID=X1SMG8_9ZZZZ
MILEIEMLKQVYDYLLEGGRVARVNSLEGLKEFLRLYEDGLTWKEIKHHLKYGCSCKELKGEEAKRALEAEL